MLANLSISEPADVTTSPERLDAIFTADVTNAALTLSYSKVGIIGYLSVLKADASVAHYADSNEGYKCNGARYYVEHITFNPDFVLSAEAHIQDGLKYIKPTTAYELNEKHFFCSCPRTSNCFPDPVGTIRPGYPPPQKNRYNFQLNHTCFLYSSNSSICLSSVFILSVDSFLHFSGDSDKSVMAVY